MLKTQYFDNSMSEIMKIINSYSQLPLNYVCDKCKKEKCSKANLV